MIMNEKPQITDPLVLDLLSKLSHDDLETDGDQRVLLVTKDQMRVLRLWANFYLNVEATGRLVSLMKGPAKLLGPIIMVFVLWRSGLINTQQVVDWLMGGGH